RRDQPLFQMVEYAIQPLQHAVSPTPQHRRFEVPAPVAARAFGDLKSKCGTGTLTRQHPCFPKFVHECAALDHELWKAGTGCDTAGSLQAPGRCFRYTAQTTSER